MLGLLRVIGLAAASNSARKNRRAMLTRNANIRLNRGRVNAAMAEAHAQKDAAANAERARIARELAAIQVEIEAVKFQIAAVETTKAAFATAVTQFA
jgi:hypothetical protein